jgi:hypothetical protein
MPNVFKQQNKNLEKLKAAMHKPYLIRKWTRSETSTSIPPHEKQPLKIQNRLSPKPEETTILHYHLKDTKENPQDNDKKFNYVEYYLNVVQ